MLAGESPACADDPGSAKGFAEARAATARRRPGKPFVEQRKTRLAGRLALQKTLRYR